MRIYALVAIGLGAAFGASSAQALPLTPGGICKHAGFGEGSAFHDECKRRVFHERRSNFWREEAPMIAVGGLVAGAAAATGGTAFAIVTRRPDPGVYRVNVDGDGFLVRLSGNDEATIRSARRYTNVGSDEPKWARAAELATGCAISRRVRDWDALYVWLACGQSPTATQTPSAVAQSRAPTPVATSGPPAVQAGPAAGGSIADEIAKLAALRDRGLLTDAEFQAAKAKLLQR